jgi:hypothetical protein
VSPVEFLSHIVPLQDVAKMKKKERISHKTVLIIRTGFIGLVVLCNAFSFFPQSAILDCLVTANIIWIISDFFNRTKHG